jgi:hypothetical protein
MTQIKAKLTSIKEDLVGLPVCGSAHNIGRQVERIFNRLGFKLQNGAGPDIYIFGVEVKTRTEGAVSPETVGTMHEDDIIATPWEDTHIFQKIQSQIRVYHNKEKITRCELFDFSDSFIQKNLRDAYEKGRHQLIENYMLCGPYIPGNKWAYFEHCLDNDGRYQFRVRNNMYSKMERMSKSNDTFHNLFDVS